MSDANSKQQSWLVTAVVVLILVVFAAFAVRWGTIAFNSWRPSVATMTLSDAVTQFNGKASDDPVGSLEPPLTVDEVVAAIGVQLQSLNARPEVIEAYQRIVETRAIPIDARLNSMNGYQPKVGPTQTVWWINLDIKTGETSGYGMRIRENNSPKAASAGS